MSRPTMDHTDYLILDCLYQGKRDRQISAVVGLSPGMVNKRIAKLRKPLGLSNRTELALWWGKWKRARAA